MRRIGDYVLRHRLQVSLIWLVVLVAGIASAGPVTKRLVLDFSLPGQPGSEASARIEQLYGNGGGTNPVVLTLTAPAGQTLDAQAAQIGSAFAASAAAAPGLRLLDEASTGDAAFRTRDGRTAFAFVYPPIDRHSFVAPTDALTAALTAKAPAGLVPGVTGEDPLSQGNSSDSGGTGVLGEALLGALGALLVLVFVFASFLAVLPLVVAAVSIMLTFLLLLPLTHLMDVSFIVQFLVGLVGLGVAIDYSLLLVQRWREERDHGAENDAAVLTAMETAGKAVVFSGITVAIGLVSLVVLPVPFMRSLGIGGALIPLASVLTTVTLTPVILSSVGPFVDRPKIRHENTASRAWTGWARGVVKNRWVALGVSTLALAALIVAVSGLKIGNAGSSSLATKGPAYVALHRLQDGGAPGGILTPIEVLTDSSQATQAAKTISGVDGVAHVFVPGAGAERSGTTVLVALPTQETSNSTTVGVIRRLRDADVSGVQGISGLGADQIDFLHAVYGNFPYVLAIIALLTFVLLARAFRSVLLPVKAILLNLLSLAATLGFMTLFWQHGHGSAALFGVHATGAVTFWVPLMLFAFLFGLSMDYEVFILSRIREEYDELGSTDAAVVTGIARTGRLVTSAALILFLAFAALASGPGTDLKVFATGLGFGILLDATVVRSLLVPALVSLFGRANWWMPTWLAKALRVHVTSAPPAALAD